MIAGFDPSITHFGWVILDQNKNGKDRLLESGVFKTSPQDGLLVQRLVTQRERTIKLLRDWNIDFVSMEAPYFGDFSTEMLFSLNQFLHEAFLNSKVFVLYIQPDTLKKMAIPNMNPKEVFKHHMVHAAKKDLDLQGKRLSEHVADSYFAGKIGCRFYNWFIERKFPDSQLTPEESKLFCYKHIYKKGPKKGVTEYKGIIYRENDQFFDYRQPKKRTEDIKKEIHNGGESTNNR